jgi:hypothetical protein
MIQGCPDAKNPDIRHLIPSPMSDLLFKIARHGLTTGDFTTAQIKDGLTKGTILPTDHYYDPNLKTWKLVSENNWDLSAEKTETKEKSSWWSWDWFWGAIGLAIMRFTLNLISKSSHENQVKAWTLIIAAVASYIYFKVRDKLASNDDPNSGQESRKPRYLWEGYVAMLLVIMLTGATFSKRGQQAWRDFDPTRKDFKYEVWSDLNRDIFPCVEIAFSKLNEEAWGKLVDNEKDDAHEFNQDKSGSTIGIRLYDVRKGDRYEVKIESDGSPPLIAPSTYVFISDGDYAHSVAYPRLAFDYAQLRSVNQTKPLNLKFTASRNGGTPSIINQTWHVRQINDCPIGMRLMTLKSNGVIKKESANVAIMTFAGYVNENHPAIPEILDEALSLGQISAFTGYQEATNVSVLRQLDAIWKALEKKDIRYSSIGTTTGSSSQVQHVRLIEDTLSTRQANCVDGSTLFASIATKIGLDAYLVLAPGHCYVAIEMPETKPIGIEMTALGSEDFSSAVSIATNKAEYSLRRNFKKFEEGDIDSGYMLVPISLCRGLGIQPIPAEK